MAVERGGVPTSARGGTGDGIPGGEENGHRSSHTALVGEKIRAIARSTGADRNTVRRIVRIAEKEGIGRETPRLDEDKLQVIRQRPGPDKAFDMCCTCVHAQSMSRMIQLRNVSEDPHRALKSRAAAAGCPFPTICCGKFVSSQNGRPLPNSESA
jgi:hypothetical protein